MKSFQSFCGLCGVLLILSVSSFVAADDADDDDIGEEVVREEIDIQDLDSVNYTSPVFDSERYHFAEHFDDLEAFKRKWVLSKAKKDEADESIAKYDGEWEVESPTRKILLNDLGLVLKSKAKHAAISSRLNKPFVFRKKPLVVQYEVTLQDGQQCGGAYLKLLTAGEGTKNLKEFYDKTPYTIMFGPDKCGNDHKLHFIFRHKNPVNGAIEEKHCKKPKSRLDSYFTDSRPHLYTLIINPDNTFQILVDNKEVNAGSLLEDFTPPVNPPEMIEDPEDRKPLDWDERETIPDPNDMKPDDWDETAPAEISDPNAVKPDGWLDDEPLTVPNPEAVKPADWDNDMDGEWEAPLVDNPVCADAPGCGKWKAPLISNPEYKGIWRAQMIPNPNYKGKWKPRTIKNPDFFQDDMPFQMSTIDAIGLELWSMSPNILFDNIVISDDPAAAADWALKTYSVKISKITKNEASLWGKAMKSMNYKPGWWGAYFVYCAIPIIVYIWYLVKRSKEDSVIDWLVNTTKENPWLWAVYLILVAFICGFVLYICCFRGSEEKEAAEEEPKKTDAVTEDSPEGEVEEAENENENKDNSEEEPEEGPAESRPSKQDLEEPANAAPDQDGEAPEAATGAPRKRRPRKE